MNIIFVKIILTFYNSLDYMCLTFAMCGHVFLSFNKILHKKDKPHPDGKILESL